MKITTIQSIQALDDIEFRIAEEIRPRTYRKLGIPLAWDTAIDELPPPGIGGVHSLLASACRCYRRVRPKFIGDRCAFEPSCSRYGEICFRVHGAVKGTRLTMERLRRCNARSGGTDLPPGFYHIEDVREKVG